MKFPVNSALNEIVGNRFFKRQWLSEVSLSPELYHFYKQCVLGLGSDIIPGTKISYFEFIECHAQHCVSYYRLCFPNDRDRGNYHPPKPTQGRIDKPSKQRRKSKRPSDRKKSNKTSKTIDISTPDLLQLS